MNDWCSRTRAENKGFRHEPTAVVAVCLFVSIATVQAGVPLPDFVLHGPLSINGQQQTAKDNVVVIARVDGVVDPVGVYKMGQSSVAGDNYVLRVRLESGADGGKQSDNAARVGQTAQLFVKQGAGSEQLLASVVLTAPGTVEHRALSTDCADTIRPTVVHAATNPGKGPSSTPCSGYIDPRFDSDNGTDANLCFTVEEGSVFVPQKIVMVFSERVRNAGSGSGDTLTADAFTVFQTGGGIAPTIASINTTTDGDRHVVTVALDRPIDVQEWTTIVAGVEDLCGNAIASNGNVGPGIDEPDRVDIGCLPGDINQSGNTSPIDNARAQQKKLGLCAPGNCPDCGGELLYYDVDRRGSFTPIDLARLQQLLLNTGNSSRRWNGQAMNHPRP